MSILKWAKKLRLIVRNYDSTIAGLNRMVASSNKLISDRTVAHIDVHGRGSSPHQVIVIGKYRGNDYVNVFPVHGDISQLIDELKRRGRYEKVGRIDDIMGCDAVIRRELG